MFSGYTGMNCPPCTWVTMPSALEFRPFSSNFTPWPMMYMPFLSPPSPSKSTLRRACAIFSESSAVPAIVIASAATASAE